MACSSLPWISSRFFARRIAYRNSHFIAAASRRSYSTKDRPDNSEPEPDNGIITPKILDDDISSDIHDDDISSDIHDDDTTLEIHDDDTSYETQFDIAPEMYSNTTAKAHGNTNPKLQGSYDVRRWIETSRLRNFQEEPISSPYVRLYPENLRGEQSKQRIHILGDDARAKFIAHAMSGVYGSVQRLAIDSLSNRYHQLQRLDDERKVHLEPMKISNPQLAKRRSGHISRLIVSNDRCTEAIKALDTVKDRLDENSVVCLISSGLGVLEDVRKKVFTVPEKTPSFLLAHMSHRIAFNRDYDAVRRLRNGLCFITSGEPADYMSPDPPKVKTPVQLIQTLQEAKWLNSAYTPFEEWFRFKFPTVMFESIIEPVCLMLDVPYSGVLANPSARKLINSLLDEILIVVRNMPEIASANAMHILMDADRTQRLMYHTLVRKKDMPSAMVRDMQEGRPVNSDYLNGYFLRRAYMMHVELPTNRMMLELIKAKQEVAMSKAEEYIPMEETSISGADNEYEG